MRPYPDPHDPQLPLLDPTQYRYELIRPLLLYPERTATQRAQETGTHPETVGRLKRRFAQQGMLGLVPDTLDVHPAQRQLRVPDTVVHELQRLKGLYTGFGSRELARIIFHTTMHRLTGQTAHRLWDRRPPAAPPTRPLSLAWLAEAYGAGGQPAEGLGVRAKAVAAAQTMGERWYAGERYRLKGELLLALSVDHQAEAETCFQQALAVARDQQAKSWELRAAMSLSQLWQRQGRRTEAHALLAPIYGWFTRASTPRIFRRRQRCWRHSGVNTRQRTPPLPPWAY